MTHLMIMQASETALIVLAGIILWATTHGSSPKTDTVQMYYLETTNPNMYALEDAYSTIKAKVSSAVLPTVTAKTITLTAWYDINKTCMDPTMVQNLWFTNPALMNRLPTEPFSPILTAQSTLLKDVTEQPGLIASPLCRCMTNVMQGFHTKSSPAAMEERVKLASKAFKACFNTNSHIPKQKQLFDNNFASERIQTRKTMSKVSLVLIICLSFLFNYLYQQLKFDDEHFYSEYRNLILLFSLLLIALLQVTLPAVFQTASHTSSILTITGLIIGPAFLVHFVFMELVWPYLKTTNRKTHIHPYVFCTTLISLMAIALYENGVFDFGVLVYHGLLAHALTFAYASVVFFTHFNTKESTMEIDIHTLMGHLAVFAGAALVVLNGVNPSYPTNCSLDYMWGLPWIYVVYVFAFSIYLERMVEYTKEEDFRKDVITSLYFLGNSLVIFVVIGFYTVRLWHVTFGETTLSHSDRVLTFDSRMNFALDPNPHRNGGDQYLIF